MARYDLSEVEWTLIAPLLPNKPRGVARVDDRRIINAIFYVLRTGSARSAGPLRSYTTAYNRYNRWAKAGVWLRIFETLVARSPHSLHLIDSSIIKHFRRIATRFDKLGRNFLSAVFIASSRLWLRNYESTTWR